MDRTDRCGIGMRGKKGAKRSDQCTDEPVAMARRRLVGREYQTPVRGLTMHFGVPTWLADVDCHDRKEIIDRAVADLVASSLAGSADPLAPTI
jgi:hypothetical protein